MATRHEGLRQLLRALHLPIEVFAQLRVHSFGNHPNVAENALIAPIPGKVHLIQCLARQLGAPRNLSFRLDTLSTSAEAVTAKTGRVVRSREEAVDCLRSTVGSSYEVWEHPTWPDVVTVAATPPAQWPAPTCPTVLVTARAGEAALRGAGHVGLRDIWGTIPEPSSLRMGARVSVFAAARDAPKKTGGRPQLIEDRLARLGQSIEAETLQEADEAVRLRVHSRRAHGPTGPETDAIFVGNGAWLPPLGVRLTHGFVPALPLTTPTAPKEAVRKKGAGKSRLPFAASAPLPKGLIPQSLPSAAVAHVLEPQPGESVLDLCAAPGGKTHHIAQLMQNRGRIVALEPGEARLRRMEAFFRDSGVQVAQCVQADGTLWSSGSSQHCFDRALVDAPCSSSGLWPRLDWHRVNVEAIRELAERQFALLTTAVREVRPGGIIVYAVCSYLPEETEHVCLRALAELPLTLEQAGPPGISATPSLGIDGGDAMGFFIARFQRGVGNMANAPEVPSAATSRGLGRTRRKSFR